MTHQIVFETHHTFSPVSQKDAERLARLEKDLEAIIRQNGQTIVPESFAVHDPWNQGEKAVSPAIRNTMPGLRIFGVKLSTPCV